MIISNNTQGGHIGIGRGFNHPQSTLDIQGNLAVSGNASFGEGIIINNYSYSTDIEGAIRFIGSDLELYMNNKWTSLTVPEPNLLLNGNILFTSHQFQIENTQIYYKYGNRITGLNSEDNNIFGSYYQHKYQIIHNNVELNSLEISIDNDSLLINDLLFTISILVNDIEKYNNSNVLISQNTSTPTIINFDTININKNDNISIRGLANNLNSTEVELLITLFGKSLLENLSIKGNTTKLFNGNINISNNLTVGGNLMIDENLYAQKKSIFNSVGIGINEPLAPLHIEGFETINSTNLSFKTSHSIQVGTNIINDSDKRIKTNIHNSSLKEDYELIKQIIPVYYDYIDNTKHNKTTRGLIAQEIETIIPEAVEEISDFIPNIMETVQIKNNIIISRKMTSILTKNDIIKIIYNNKEYLLVITNVNILTDTITVNNFSYSNCNINIFVYGTKIDNYKVLNYNYINNVMLGAVKYIIEKIDHIN